MKSAPSFACKGRLFSKNWRLFLPLLLLFLAMISCSGSDEGGIGGSGGIPAGGGSVVTGVAAAGAPLVGTVTLKDSSGTTKQLSTSLALDGSYSLNVSGLTPPFLLQAAGTAGGNSYTLYSLAATVGNCNINPLTHLAVTMANSGQDPTGVFTAPTPAKIASLANALPAAVASIQNKLAPMFSQVGVAPVNIMTDQMAANGQGVDLLFDMISFPVSDGTVTMVNKADGGTILAATSITGGVLTASTTDVVPVSTITGHSVGGNVTAQSKAPPYPATPVMTVAADAQGNYRFFVPNGAYEVCGYGATSFNCLDVTVNNGNVIAPDFPPAEQVPLQTVEQASVSPSQIAGGVHVLRSTKAWSSFWSMLKASLVQQPPLPAVNFPDNTVIAVVDAGRPTGGYSITITDIRRSPTGVAVHAVHRSPGPGCIVTQATEQPYHIVTVPAFSGEATLNLTETVESCSTP